MLLNENLFEAVQESDVRGNYKKKALNKEKLYDKIIDKIQRELSKKGFKVGTDGDYLFVNKKIFKQPNKEGKIVTKSKFMLDKKDYTDLINYLDSIGIEHYFKDDIEGLGLILNINLENVDKIKLTEDIEKTKSGKWVNKGKEGTHGEFETKKAAREQQKAMFAQGFKEDLGSDIAEYQKWIDYDMKKYGRISNDTNEKIRKAGLEIIKDKYGDYEVIANEPIREDLNEPTIEEMFKYLKEYPQYNHQYTRPAKYYDLDLTPEQQDEFLNFLQDDVNGLGNFWEENAVLSQDIYQEGRLGGHLVLDTAILEPRVFDDIESVDEMIEDELEHNYYPNNDDGTYDERQKQDAKEDVEKEIKDSYITLKDFDERVNKLIENLKATLDARIEDKSLDEKLENNEIDDFFNKAKKLGVKNLSELKRLLNEPEAVGKTEKEKMDSYYKASNPKDKDLNEDTTNNNIYQMFIETIEEYADEHDLDLDNLTERNDIVPEAGDYYKAAVDDLISLGKEWEGYFGKISHTVLDDIKEMVEEKLGIGEILKKLKDDATKYLTESFKVVDKNGKKVPQGGGFTSRKEAEMFAAQYGEKDLKVVKESLEKSKTFNSIRLTERSNATYSYYFNFNKPVTKEQIDSFKSDVQEGKSYLLDIKKRFDVSEVKKVSDLIKPTAVISIKLDESLTESIEDEHLGRTSEEVAPDSVKPGPEAGIAGELNKLIIDEWEAIQGYNDAIVAAELEGYNDIVKVLKDIVNEEMNHVGMLESALVTVSPNTQTIEDGEVEAQEILANEGEITADITEAFDVDKVKKRVARVNEFDNGHVLFNYENITSAEAEEKAKQLSLKYPNDIFYVAYDDVMNPASDIKWKNGQQISNKKELSPNADSIEQGEVEASEQLTEAVDTKQAWLKEMAQDDWDVGHTFDPDDFHEFKKIAKECGFNVNEKDFERYFEYLEDIESEYYNSDMDESIKK